MADLLEVKDVMKESVHGDCGTPSLADIVSYFVMPGTQGVRNGTEPDPDKVTVLGYQYVEKDVPQTAKHVFTEAEEFLVTGYNAEAMTTATGYDASISTPAKLIFGYNKEIADKDALKNFFSTEDNYEGNNVKLVDGEPQLINEDKTGIYYVVTREYCENQRNATRYTITKKTIERYENEDHIGDMKNILGYLKFNKTAKEWRFVEITSNTIPISEMPTDQDLIVLKDCTKAGSYKTYTFTNDYPNSNQYVTETIKVAAHDAKVVVVVADAENQNKPTETPRGKNKVISVKLNGNAVSVFASAKYAEKAQDIVDEMDEASNGTGIFAKKQAGYWVPASYASDLELTSNICNEQLPYKLLTVCANYQKTRTEGKCEHKPTVTAKKAPYGTVHRFDGDVRLALKDYDLNPVITGSGKDAELIGYAFGKFHAYMGVSGSDDSDFNWDAYSYFLELDEDDPTIGSLYEEAWFGWRYVNGEKEYSEYKAGTALGKVKLGECTATCLENGKMDVTPLCTLCGAELATINTNVLRHEEQAGEPTRRILEDSTCNKQGKAVVETKCVICGRLLKSEDKVIERKKHTFGDVTASLTGNDVVVSKQATDVQASDYKALKDAFNAYKKYGEVPSAAYGVYKDTHKEVSIGRTNYEITVNGAWTCTVCGEPLYVSGDTHSFEVDGEKALVNKDGNKIFRYVYITDLQKEDSDSRTAGSITVKVVAYGVDKGGEVYYASDTITRPFYSDWLAYLDRVNPEEAEKVEKAQKAAEEAAAKAKANPTDVNIRAAESAVLLAKSLGADTAKAEKDLADAIEAAKKAQEAEEEAKRKAEEEARRKAEEEAKRKAEYEEAQKKAAAQKAADAKASEAKKKAETAKAAPTNANLKAAEEAVKDADLVAKDLSDSGKQMLNEAKSAMSVAKAENASPVITFGSTKVNNKLNKSRTATHYIKLKKGAKLELKAVSSNGEKIEYWSNNKKVAKVSSSGVITAKKTGKGSVTVKCGNTNVRIKIKVVK